MSGLKLDFFCDSPSPMLVKVFSFVDAFVINEVYWSSVNRAYGSLSMLSVAGFFM